MVCRSGVGGVWESYPTEKNRFTEVVTSMSDAIRSRSSLGVGASGVGRGEAGGDDEMVLRGLYLSSPSSEPRISLHCFRRSSTTACE